MGVAIRVAIRADAAAAIGWGHVKRCLALAQALRAWGADVRFFSAASDVDAASLVAAEGFACTALPRWQGPAHDAAATAHAMSDHAAGGPPAVLVVDHYQLAADWHQALRQATGCAVVVIDDLADRPLAADLVIDHNPVRDAGAKYRPVLAQPSRLCAGPRYALLAPVYRDHARCQVGATLHSIGIFMGGSDPARHSQLAWRACREQADWQGLIEIASTSSNPHLAGLRRLAESDRQTRLLIDQPDLAAFHQRHGLQIGAGGGALWERCCLGVPTLALVCADNQRHSVPRLAEAGVVLGLDASSHRVDSPDGRLLAPLGQAIRALVASPGLRQQLQQRSIAWVDGLGADRAAAAVLALAGRAGRRNTPLPACEAA